MIALLSCRPGEPIELPVLRILATDSLYSAPTVVAPLLVRVKLVNHGTGWHEGVLVRFEGSASVTTYLPAARAGQSTPAGAVDLAGPGIVAGRDSSEVLLHLRPGRYGILCWTRDHVKRGAIVPFTVSGPARPEPPSPPTAETVELREYNFGLSAPLRAGPQLVRVANHGTRLHELALYRLEAGRSFLDFAGWYRRQEGPPPAFPVGGVASIAPGGTVLWPVTLHSGGYFMVCGVKEGAQAPRTAWDDP
jgi:hypothetical protein